ncbi:hypothetical protein PG993_015148 [Apiospora rasikravindrae]|uniref:F-box domain-containing protein n=1 Tax=Apiospora rasikravindrae TaxID=990691 RepID=A0ABR1RPS6_9PEZI
MSMLSRLPAEVVSMILTALGDLDLKTLIVAQSVCTQFRDLIETVAFRTRHLQPTESGELEFDPFLRAEFSSIVQTLDSKDQTRLYHMYLNLPWAQTESSREPYLRPGASWRRLCLTVGGPPITCLERRSRPIAPWLTMGCVYDMLLMSRDLSQEDAATENWQLRLGQRVADYNVAAHVCHSTAGYGSVPPSEEALAPMYTKDAASKQTAVLQVHMTSVHNWCGTDYSAHRLFQDLWYPCPQGGDFFGFQPRPWQGPMPKKVPDWWDELTGLVSDPRFGG